MSNRRQNYTPCLPGMQRYLSGRPNLSSQESLRRQIAEVSSKELWEFRCLFGNWIDRKLLCGSSHVKRFRNRIFSVEVVFWAFLNQVFLVNTGCTSIVKKVQSWMIYRRRRPPSSNTSAYCQARGRLPLELLRSIQSEIVKRLEGRIVPGEKWCGRTVKVVDGTGLSMPDTIANQDSYPQSRSMTEGCGFPMMNVTGVFSLCSGALLGYAYGNKHIHENTLWRCLWKLLCPGDVILGDRGFCTFANVAEMFGQGVDSVIRLHEWRGKKMLYDKQGGDSANDRTAQWIKPRLGGKHWSEKEWHDLPAALTLRVITVYVANNGFRTQKLSVITTLLNRKKYPAEAIAELYFKRWKVELFYRDIKTSMGMEVLKSLTPEQVNKELAMYAIAYNLVRALMQEAAHAYEVALERISFKGTLQQLNQWLWLFFNQNHSPTEVARLRQEFLAKMVDAPLPERPGRNEPRAKKRRPKNYCLLTKPRSEMRINCHRNRPEKKYGFPALS